MRKWTPSRGKRRETVRTIGVRLTPHVTAWYTLRVWRSGRSWLAAVYRGYATDAGAMVAGTRSRHDSADAAKQKLRAWARGWRKEKHDA